MSRTEYLSTSDLADGGWGSDLVVGKRIASVDSERSSITLDDGTVLNFLNEGDCCSWFGPTGIKTFPFGDNIITAITELPVAPAASSEAYEAYEVVFLHENQELARVGVEGDPGSGYYMTVGSVEVTLPSTGKDMG